MDTSFLDSSSETKVYVVQTKRQRLSALHIDDVTDPGDLVLDPTCGSGTTAYVAEQWGRRWITIDTSRVALALARARIMGARYPYYLLSDSRDGQLKEAESHGKHSLGDRPSYNDIRQGFVYERVPHITLKSIANNAEIDVIWDKWQAALEPLRESTQRRAQEDLAGVGDSTRGRCQVARRDEEATCRLVAGSHRPAARRSTLPSPPRPSLNTSTTSPTRTRRPSAWPDLSRSRA